MVVLTRHGCHLCEEAHHIADLVSAELGTSVTTIDVDTDASLRDAFTDHVPVTFVDGALLSYWFLDEDALRAALSQAPATVQDDWYPPVVSLP